MTSVCGFSFFFFGFWLLWQFYEIAYGDGALSKIKPHVHLEKQLNLNDPAKKTN